MTRNPHRQKGFSLIITLWITVVLTTTALCFSHSVLLDQRRCANTASGIQAEQTLSAAVRYVQAVLDIGDYGDALPDEGAALLEGVPVGSGTFWLVGRRPVDEQFASTSVTEAGEGVEFGLVDEASKLNLNTATRDMLLALPGMTSELAAAIIDWRDSNDEPDEGGAESETYLRLDRPYECKNAPFDSPEELRLVYGMDVNILFGKDRNLNGVIDVWESDSVVDVLLAASPPSQPFGLLEYVTVWSRESNTGSESEPKVNVNERDSSALISLLQRELGGEVAERVRSAARPGQTLYRSLLEFFLASGLDEQQFAKIDDSLTVYSNEWTEGLVNVNTASATVLGCLPGMEDGDAERLVAYRAQNPDSLTSVAWVARVFDRQKAARIGPAITATISQVSADLVALGEGGRGLRRCFVVFDLSGESIRIAYRRDRTGLGWCLGEPAEEEFDI